MNKNTVPLVDNVEGYHAHVYFDAVTREQAQQVCQTATDIFGIEMGHMHQKPVGPHPCWSCQLSFSAQQFAAVVTWLAMHRDGLTVFIHPLSGDDLRDHRDFAMWLGKVEPLSLGMFIQ